MDRITSEFAASIAGREFEAGPFETTVEASPGTPKLDSRPTLADVGVDKKLSSRAQKIAALPSKQFEARIETVRAAAEEGGRVSVDILSRTFAVRSAPAAAELESGSTGSQGVGNRVGKLVGLSINY